MNSSITRKQLREFGLLIGFFFPMFFGFLVPIIYGYSFKVWTLLIGIIFLSCGLLKPKLLYYPYKFWMKIGFILGWVNSKLILGLIFFLMVLPLALIMRCFGYDPLKKNKLNIHSYREKRNSSRIDLTRIF